MIKSYKKFSKKIHCKNDKVKMTFSMIAFSQCEMARVRMTKVTHHLQCLIMKSELESSKQALKLSDRKKGAIVEHMLFSKKK